MYALVDMISQSSSVSTFSSNELDSLSNNLVEAMQILYKSVAKRKIKEKIEKIKNETNMKDEGEEYGKYNRI